MKKATLLALILVNIISLGCMNKVKRSHLLENQLQQILKEKEYFKLKQLLDGANEKIRPEKSAYFSAFVESAFNHTDESINTIERLKEKDSSSMNDSEKVALLLLQRNNYFKIFQYKKAASIGKELLEKHQATIGVELHDIRNTLIIHEGLSNILPQKIHLQSDTLLWKRNKLGLIEIPFRIKNKNFNIIFDTRAYISTVTKSFAKKIRLRMLPFSYKESSGITGKTFKSEMGIADSLYR